MRGCFLSWAGHFDMRQQGPRVSLQARPRSKAPALYAKDPALGKPIRADDTIVASGRPTRSIAGVDDGGSVLVRIRGLSFSHGHRKILDNIDLDIRRGLVTGIMGPSGAGKTTLLKLISGQLRPDSGTVEVEGRDVHRLSRRELFRLRTGMGKLIQSGALLTDLSVFENVAYPLREHTRLPNSMIRKLVLMKLEAVGLRGARDLMPAQLSGGMARRVALARAVALDPSIVLYDEPFTGQDPISMGVLMTLIRHLNDACALTSILVSHDVQETASIADYVYILGNGRVMAGGTPAAVGAGGADWVDQFMRGLPDGPVHFHYPAPPLERDLLG
ncbi:MAG: ABC transporter ATP-binding protein [Chromatiaceae bacterium]|nr:ABC transporter ATP-binding protein [Chromatiaceae bacterium]